ncbi:hypothetical protein OUZ56_012430 [Daphnia magna]|uniref:Uncharacterized protein n=1 Tax=Daphnia magna TaxID=35525 RepID=A0ABQ9Z484_9CRUS|nr:hypothetical protein OUZ56_012430 [Daphnia magna]
MKLYRWLSAQGCGLSDLFPGVKFVGDTEFELHAEKINKVKPKGETYRHLHYLHDFAYRSGCKFLCYDVVWKYWSFAADISEELEEFKCHTKNMQPFLSRWHGKTHAWYGQILFSGHWLKGACLTTDETTEQTN